MWYKLKRALILVESTKSDHLTRRSPWRWALRRPANESRSIRIWRSSTKMRWVARPHSALMEQCSHVSAPQTFQDIDECYTAYVEMIGITRFALDGNDFEEVRRSERESRLRFQIRLGRTRCAWHRSSPWHSAIPSRTSTCSRRERGWRLCGRSTTRKRRREERPPE